MFWGTTFAPMLVAYSTSPIMWRRWITPLEDDGVGLSTFHSGSVLPPLRGSNPLENVCCFLIDYWLVPYLYLLPYTVQRFGLEKPTKHPSFSIISRKHFVSRSHTSCMNWNIIGAVILVLALFTGLTVAAQDSDGDGLSDSDEKKIHETDPKKADTDADGLSDGEEVNEYGTNPQSADSDNDGVSDGKEVKRGTSPYEVNRSWMDNVLLFISNDFGRGLVVGALGVIVLGFVISRSSRFVETRRG